MGQAARAQGLQDVQAGGVAKSMDVWLAQTVALWAFIPGSQPGSLSIRLVLAQLIGQLKKLATARDHNGDVADRGKKHVRCNHASEQVEDEAQNQFRSGMRSGAKI